MYFKELVYRILAADIFKLYRLAWQARGSEKNQINSSSLNLVRLQNSFLFEEGQSFILLRPSTDWMTPPSF